MVTGHTNNDQRSAPRHSTVGPHSSCASDSLGYRVTAARPETSIFRDCPNSDYCGPFTDGIAPDGDISVLCLQCERHW